MNRGQESQSPQVAPSQMTEGRRNLLVVSCFGVIVLAVAGLAVSGYFAVNAVNNSRQAEAEQREQAVAELERREAKAQQQADKSGPAESSQDANPDADIEPDPVRLDNLNASRPLIEKKPAEAPPAAASGQAELALNLGLAQPPPEMRKWAPAGDLLVSSDPKPPLTETASSPEGKRDWRDAVRRFREIRPFKCTYRLGIQTAGGIALQTWGRYSESADGLWRQETRYETILIGGGGDDPRPKEAHVLCDGARLWCAVRWTDGVTRVESYPAGRKIRWDKPVPIFDRERFARIFLERSEGIPAASIIINFPDKRYLTVKGDQVAQMNWNEEFEGKKVPWSLSIITSDEAPEYAEDHFRWSPPADAEAISHD
ncbi:MAG TPA: hypothetical protein PL033_16405 [Candidatus Brocadiia bacterium]|nr:hypothetical protein [Candidatus Brocadiia bacterium]